MILTSANKSLLVENCITAIDPKICSAVSICLNQSDFFLYDAMKIRRKEKVTHEYSFITSEIANRDKPATAASPKTGKFPPCSLSCKNSD